MQTRNLTKIDQSKEAWDNRGFQETALTAQMPKFSDFWDEQFGNLDFGQQEIILRHYQSMGEIPL